MSSAFNIPAGWREVLARAKEGLGAGGRNHGDQAFIDYGAALIDHIEEGIEALTAPTHPVDAVPGEPVARNEHIDEIRATLQGSHAIMESVCAMERRIGPVGSHARGYTWKINAALRHLDALAASVASRAGSELERVANLRDALHLIIGVTEGKDCPGLDDPTDFALAQSRGIRLSTVRRMAVAARAADIAPAAAAGGSELVAPLSKSQSKGMNQADLVAYADRERAASLVAQDNVLTEQQLSEIVQALDAKCAVMEQDTKRLDWLEKRRVSIIPEFEGPWDATIYDDEGEPQSVASGNTPRTAIDAARASAGEAQS